MFVRSSLRKRTSVRIAMVALATVFAATACGADSTGELDKGDLVDELKKAGLEDGVADCAADAMIDADFTKDELDELNAGGEIDDAEKTEAFTDAITECVMAS